MVTAAAAVLAAILALIAAVHSARVSRATASSLELLKADLAREAADAQSKRAFEDAARQRVYRECEPIIIKLATSCDIAADRIVELADPRRWPELSASRDIDSFWMLAKSSEVISMARALLEPLCYYTLLSEKVTHVDLTFDRRVAEIYTLARAAYSVHLNDYKIAAMKPEIAYDPVVPGWRQKRAQEPAAYWWQGLTRGRLDPAIELCIHRGEGRLTTLAEFERRYLDLFDRPKDSQSKSLGLFCNPVYNFTPTTRPVYWRMLMSLLLIYRRISLRSRLPAEIATSRRFEFNRRDVSALQAHGAIPDAFLDSGFDVALRYADDLLQDARIEAA